MEALGGGNMFCFDVPVSSLHHLLIPCVCGCVLVCLFAGVCVSLRVQECALFVNASGVCVCMCVVYGFVCVCVHAPMNLSVRVAVLALYDRV